MVGNLKRWKTGELTLSALISGETYTICASRRENLGDGTFAVDFRWDPPGMTFSEILDITGAVPLPPYIRRAAEASDDQRYQTVYAIHEGSVAAPTAGLHFTESILDQISRRGFQRVQVTLHVGAGTFKPVGISGLGKHTMHQERITVTRETIEKILAKRGKPVIAVGTTSVRTLESLYWFGTLASAGNLKPEPSLSQWEPYHADHSLTIGTEQALTALLSWLDQHRLNSFHAETRLMIIPGYRFRVVSGLVTNFHMPRSTLLLLVAALTGDDWKRVYGYALSGGFRFLSYGDACLFLKTG